MTLLRVLPLPNPWRAQIHRAAIPHRHPAPTLARCYGARGAPQLPPHLDLELMESLSRRRQANMARRFPMRKKEDTLRAEAAPAPEPAPEPEPVPEPEPAPKPIGRPARTTTLSGAPLPLKPTGGRQRRGKLIKEVPAPVPEPLPEAEPWPQTQAEAQAEPWPEAQTEPWREAQTEPWPEARAKPWPEAPWPEVEAQPQPDPEPEPESSEAAEETPKTPSPPPGFRKPIPRPKGRKLRREALPWTGALARALTRQQRKAKNHRRRRKWPVVTPRRWDVSGEYRGFRWLNSRFAHYPMLATAPDAVRRRLHRRALLYRRKMLRRAAQQAEELKQAQWMAQRIALGHYSRLDRGVCERAHELGLESRERDAGMIFVLFFEHYFTQGVRRAPNVFMDEIFARVSSNRKLAKLLVTSLERRRFKDVVEYVRENEAVFDAARLQPDTWPQVTKRTD